MKNYEIYKEKGKYDCIIKRKQLRKPDLLDDPELEVNELGDNDFKTIYRITCEGLSISGEYWELCTNTRCFLELKNAVSFKKAIQMGLIVVRNRLRNGECVNKYESLFWFLNLYK